MNIQKHKIIFIKILILSCCLSIIYANKNESHNYIRIEQRDGVWWFVDKHGKTIFSLGANHACQAQYWLKDYNIKNTKERFGHNIESINNPGTFNYNSDAWNNLRLYIDEKISEYNFNTYGMHTDTSVIDLEKSSFYYTAELRTMPYGYSGMVQQKNADKWRDVFSNEWVLEVNEKAKELAKIHKGNEKLLGYYFTDEPIWYINEQRLFKYPQLSWWKWYHPWVNYIRCLPAKAQGKIVWIELLKNHYSTAIEAAQAYHVDDKTWTDLINRRNWPQIIESDSQATYDSDQFLKWIAWKWYKTKTTALKKHDPNRLVFGDKHAQKVPEWMFPILKKYVDVVAVQLHGPFDNFTTHLKDLHMKTGKPILNGDGNCKYTHNKTQIINGYKVPIQDEESMASGYTDYLNKLASAPYMIGFHHCGFTRRFLPKNKWGILKVDGSPYEIFSNAVKEANKKAHQLHEDCLNR